MLRAGIIGWTGRGDYGHGLDRAFLGVPEVETVAVADPDPAGRAAAAARCGASRTYASYEEMFLKERLDVVSVASRHADTHEEPVVAAADHGAHIFCEKPLATSLDAADRMVDACERAGVKMAVAHQNRAWPAPCLAKELITSDFLGRLRAMRAYGKLDSRGGGQDLIVLGTHMLDLMRFFAGDAQTVNARVTQGNRNATPQDIHPGSDGVGLVAGDGVWAQYDFDNGVVGTYESFVAVGGGSADYFRMELYGTAGALCFPSGPRQELLHCVSPSPVPGQATWDELPVDELLAGGLTVKEEMHPANQALVRDLLAAVAEDRQPISSIYDARSSLEMILGVYRSHFSGSRIALPLRDRDHPLEHLRRRPTAEPLSNHLAFNP